MPFRRSSLPLTGTPSDRPPPARRVSALVTHFESAAAPILSPASAVSIQPHAPPLAPASAPFPGNRVREQVERLHSRDTTSVGSSVAQTEQGRGSLGFTKDAVVVGDLDEMDWRPRPRHNAPGAEPRFSPKDASATRLPVTALRGKAKVADTILVPATVSPATSSEDRPKMTIERPKAPADEPGAAVERSTPGAGPLDLAPQQPGEREANPLPLSPRLPPEPHAHPLHLTTTPVAHHSARPRLEARRSSVTWAELVSPRPDSVDIVSDSASLLSTNSTAPLLDLSRSPRPPSISRALSVHSASTAPAHFPSSRFTIASIGTTSTRYVYAYELFARNAEPLVLSELDRVLASLGGPAHFSPMPGAGTLPARSARVKGGDVELSGMEKKGVAALADAVFGSELERERWETWVRGKPASRWSRFASTVSGTFSTRRTRVKQEEHDPLAAAADEAGVSLDQYRRTLKFPPFHLLAANLTVTDLKANRRQPPPLLNLQSLLLTTSNGLLGAAGSSMGLRLTSIEGLRDLMQMVTLLLTAASPALSTLTTSSWSASTRSRAESSTLRILFVTVPSFLSLDFVSAFGQALVFLLILTVITLGALYEFFRFTGGWRGPSGTFGRGQLDLGEGYDREDTQERGCRWRDSYTWRIVVTFWCGSLYLPLSKLAIGALVWTDDFWAVTNPYELFGVDNPSPPPLGLTSEYYDSMNFCWRTTMRRRDGARNLNLAFALVPIAVVVLAVLSAWFPWRMWQVVKREAPRVDSWTELGERRRDPDAEYERLLDVDPSPFNYLYRDYRKRWAAFRSIYLVFKLINALLVVLIQKNNCVFRRYSETYLSVVRQGSLLAFLALFFIASALSSPYLTRISNSSDIVSRIGYVFLALLGLLAALTLPGTDPAVVTTNVVVYSLNIYFTLVSLEISQGIVKKLERRLDSSIDIFSPRLDVSKHLSRRVWQETLAALLLCSPELAMKPSQTLAFAQDADLSPYLLHFGGSPAERFVENLKILREIGLDAYSDAIRYRALSPDSRIMRLRRSIQLRYTGPDVYYRPEGLTLPVTSYFGRVDVTPFPFVVVFRYDQVPTKPLHLVEADELERLVKQNRRAHVVAARRVRLALRALEDQRVFAPHVEIQKLGGTGGADVERHVSYRMATLRIERNSTYKWRGYNCSSGFKVSLEYADGEGPKRDGRLQRGQKLVLAAAGFGVQDDFQLTPALAKLLRRNRVLVEQRLPGVERSLLEHRNFFRHEADFKRRVLSHSFLLTAFAEDRLSAQELDLALRESELNPQVQQLVQAHKASITRLEERMGAVTGDSVRGWWYLYWDDLWRRNHDIGLPEEAFSPHYASSVCYHPMERAELEAFLHRHGFSKGQRAYFHTGLLNRLYFQLDEQIFSSTSGAIPIHLSSSPERVPFDALPRTLAPSHPPPPAERRTLSTGTALSRFTADTGGGTSEDDRNIRHRRAFLFEEVYERPAPHFRRGTRTAWARFQVEVRLAGWAKRFFGLEPVVREWRPSEEEGIVLVLRRGRAGWEAPRLREEEKL